MIQDKIAQIKEEIEKLHKKWEGTLSQHYAGYYDVDFNDKMEKEFGEFCYKGAYQDANAIFMKIIDDGGFKIIVNTSRQTLFKGDILIRKREWEELKSQLKKEKGK